MFSSIVPALGWLIPLLYLTFSTALALSNLAMLLILVAFGLTFKTAYFEKSYWSQPAIWLLALYAMVLLGTLYTPAPWEWVAVNLGKYTKILYAIVLMILLTKREDWQRRSLLAFEVGALFILASTWLNIWFVLPWSATKNLGWGVSHNVMYDYIVQNVMMAFFVTYALSKITREGSRLWNAFYGVVALLAILSITHLSVGRTGLLVVAGALAAFLLARLGTRRALIAIPVAVLALGVLLASSDVMVARFKQATVELANAEADRYSSIGHRIYNYKLAPKLIAEKPIFGHGTGAYHTEVCRVLDDPDDCETYRWHSHNQFLFFGVDHGAIGILIYVALLWSAGVVAWRTAPGPHKLMLASLLGALIADSFINSPLFSARESHFFLYMLALLLVISRDRTR